MSSAGELHLGGGGSRQSDGAGYKGGYEGAGGRDTRSARRAIPVGWFPRISAFIRAVSSSFRRWIQRLPRSAADSFPTATLIRLFLGISSRTRNAAFRRIELKCDLSTYALNRKIEIRVDRAFNFHPSNTCMIIVSISQDMCKMRDKYDCSFYITIVSSNKTLW